MSPANKARNISKNILLIDSALVTIGFFSVIPLIAIHYVEDLGWAASLVGLALALRQLAQQGLTVFGGARADKYGTKPFIVSGMFIRSIGFLSLSFAQSAPLLFAACTLIGLGGALFESPRGALIAKIIRPKDRNRFYSFITAIDNTGIVIGVFIGTIFLKIDFTIVTKIGAALFLSAALLNYFAMPSYKISKISNFSDNLTSVFKDIKFIKYSFTLMGYFFLMVQIFMILPITMKNIANNENTITIMYSLEIALSILLLYPLTAIFNKFNLSPQARIVIGTSIMAFSLLSIGFVISPFFAWFFLSTYYIWTLISAPAQSEITAQLAKKEARGMYIGFSRIGLGIGGAAGNLGIGWLLDYSKEITMPLLPWIILASIGTITAVSFLIQFFLNNAQSKKYEYQ